MRDISKNLFEVYGKTESTRNIRIALKNMIRKGVIEKGKEDKYCIILPLELKQKQILAKCEDILLVEKLLSRRQYLLMNTSMRDRLTRFKDEMLSIKARIDEKIPVAAKIYRRLDPDEILILKRVVSSTAIQEIEKQVVTNIATQELDNDQVAGTLSREEKSVDDPELGFQGLELLEVRIKNFSIDELRNYVRESFLHIDTGRAKLNTLIVSIVKDNHISEAERNFLRRKLKEYGLPLVILEHVEKMVGDNNPSLDPIIDLLFENPELGNEEFRFIKEKIKESSLSELQGSRRFLKKAISFHIYELLKNTEFYSLAKSWGLLYSINKDEFNAQVNDFCNSNIFSFESFDKLFTQFFNRSKQYTLEYIGKRISQSDTRGVHERLLEHVVISEPSQIEVLDVHSVEKFVKVLREEKTRIGTPDADLLAENIIFRIKNNLWD